MNAFLITFVIIVALNLVAVLIDRFRSPVTTGHRVLAVVIDTAMAAWAMYLLGGAA